jgi:hypothetical protein
MTFTSGHFEIRKWPKNYQNLLRTFIETFTPNSTKKVKDHFEKMNLINNNK